MKGAMRKRFHGGCGKRDVRVEARPTVTTAPAERAVMAQPINLPSVNQFVAEMDDFAQCIINNKPSKVSGEEGLRDVKIMQAIYESARTGQPVKLA